MKYKFSTNIPHKILGLTIFFGILLMQPLQVVAAGSEPTWHPLASERLVKLSTKNLEKSIARDFRGSGLSQAISVKHEEISLKVQTLKDLKGAIEMAEGDVRIELRHQLLAQKRDLLNLMSSRSELRGKHLKTKSKLYSRVLDSIQEKEIGQDPATQTLVSRQEAAAERFNSTFKDIDMKLFENSSAPESRYNKKYNENLKAIEKLVRKTEAHGMNVSESEDATDKKTYVRRLISDTEAEAALIAQEEKIIGYMAKLLSLDALELSEEASDPDLADSSLPAQTGAAVVVDLFTNN